MSTAPDGCVYRANGKKYVPLDFHNYLIREIINSFEEEIMESKTTQQMKAADVATAVTSSLSQPGTKFIVIRPERAEDGNYESVEVSVIAEETPAPAK